MPVTRCDNIHNPRENSVSITEIVVQSQIAAIIVMNVRSGRLLRVFSAQSYIAQFDVSIKQFSSG